MAEFVAVAKLNQVEEGKGIKVEAKGHDIALFKKDGKVYAIQQHCAHHGGPLSDGSLEGFIVTCPWHGMTYDIRTGKAAPEAWDHEYEEKTYKVKIEGNEIKVEIP